MIEVLIIGGALIIALRVGWLAGYQRGLSELSDDGGKRLAARIYANGVHEGRRQVLRARAEELLEDAVHEDKVRLN